MEPGADNNENGASINLPPKPTKLEVEIPVYRMRRIFISILKELTSTGVSEAVRTIGTHIDEFAGEERIELFGHTYVRGNTVDHFQIGIRRISERERMISYIAKLNSGYVEEYGKVKVVSFGVSHRPERGYTLSENITQVDLQESFGLKDNFREMCVQLIADHIGKKVLHAIELDSRDFQMREHYVNKGYKVRSVGYPNTLDKFYEPK